MRTPEAVAADHPGRRGGSGCLVSGLAVVGAVAILAVLAGAVWFFSATRASGDAPSSPVSPQASSAAGGSTPPADLAQGEVWVSDLHLTSKRMVREGMDITDVTATGSNARVAADGTIRAGHLDLDGVVPYASVATKAPGGASVTLAPVDDGLVRVTTAVAVFGRSLPITVDASVTADGGRLVIDPVRLVDGGPLGAAVGLVPPIHQDVPGLPDGMSLQSVQVADAGFHVHAAGDGVTISG